MLGVDDMENKYDICNIVVTYYPDILELKRTLFSIINQKNVNSQIIICDDGTPNFSDDEIIRFFSDYSYADYNIVMNKNNEGTVRNLASAFPYIKSELVKTISPKDYIYCDESYQKVLSIYKNKSFDIYIGDAVYYSNGDGLVFFNIGNPCKKIKGSGILNNKKTAKQLIKYRDWFLGAAFVIKTNLFIDYIEKLIGANIKFCEDLSTVFFPLDNRKIYYDKSYFIWYEYGTGISTSRNTEFEKLLLNDYELFFESFLPKTYNLRIVKKSKKLNVLLRNDTLFGKIKRIILNPLYFLYKHFYRMSKKINPNKNYIVNIINEVK